MELLSNLSSTDLKLWLDLLSHVFFALVIIATVVVRITPTKSDDEKLNKFLGKFHKVVSWLPTIGINPKTKEMEEWFEKNKPSKT